MMVCTEGPCEGRTTASEPLTAGCHEAIDITGCALQVNLLVFQKVHIPTGQYLPGLRRSLDGKMKEAAFLRENNDTVGTSNI